MALQCQARGTCAEDVEGDHICTDRIPTACIRQVLDCRVHSDAAGRSVGSSVIASECTDSSAAWKVRIAHWSERATPQLGPCMRTASRTGGATRQPSLRMLRMLRMLHRCVWYKRRLIATTTQRYDVATMYVATRQRGAAGTVAGYNELPE